MQKITRKQRLDLSENGFYRCGNIQIENVEVFISDPSPFAGLLTEQFADAVRANNTKVTIDEIRSKYFIDSDGVYYDYAGKTYQRGQFLIHVYSYKDGAGLASITLIA